MLHEMEIRQHNGLDDVMCATALELIAAINQLPRGHVQVIDVADQFRPNLLHVFHDISAVADNFLVRITDSANNALSFNDYIIMGHDSYEGGVIIYMGDGSDVELISSFCLEV